MEEEGDGHDHSAFEGWGAWDGVDSSFGGEVENIDLIAD